MAVPEDYRLVTAQWLTHALRAGGIGDEAVVTSFRAERLGEEQGFTGALARLDLTYAHPVEGAPSSLVAKLSPPLSDLDVGRREVAFYEEIASGRQLPVPICYYGEVDPDSGAGVLLLEDLSHLRGVNFLDGCTPDEAEAAVLGLAAIHAAWWNDPALETLDWAFSLAGSSFPDWWARYPQKVELLLPGIALPASFVDFGERFATDMPLVLEQLEGRPFTVIHRDIHVDNLLFGSRPEDPAAVLIDWQLAGVGKGVSDVAFLLMSSLSPADRRTSERRLVSRYHNRLGELGVVAYSLEQCWADYVVSAAGRLFITVAATVLLDNSTAHQKEWRRVDLERLAAFVEDHLPGEAIDLR